MAAQPNIGGAVCESSVIPFLVPRHKIYKHKNESKHSELGPVRQNPIQRHVKLIKKLCNYIMTCLLTVVRQLLSFTVNSFKRNLKRELFNTAYADHSQ